MTFYIGVFVFLRKPLTLLRKKGSNRSTLYYLSGLITKIPRLKRRPMDWQEAPCTKRKVQGTKAKTKDTRRPVDYDAWLDIHARGFYELQRSAFLYVRVCHPDAESYKDLHLNAATDFSYAWQREKPLYSRRVLGIKYGTFRPLVFTTTGVMGKKCLRYHKLILSWVPPSWKGSNMLKLCHGSEAELIKRSSAWH